MSLTHIRANKIILCLFLMAISLSLPAYAQKKNITGMEKGVLAFYKLSGMNPHFDKWVKTNLTELYGNNPVPTEIFEQEKLRLQYGLGTYDPEREILKINTTVLSQHISSNAKTYLASRFPGKAAQKAPYFPYKAGHTWVAVIINNLEDYLVLELDKEDKQKISMLMPQHDQSTKLNMELHFRPVSAQSEPIQVDGLKQYPMLGEIAYLAFKKPALAGQKEDSVIWEYFAPWYRSADEQNLLDILEGP